MEKERSIQLFEQKHIRHEWDAEQEKWYFSVVDVVGVLTDSPDPRNYWKVLKNRLKKEGNESVTNCNQLKLQSSDGKFYKTDVADKEQLLRLIQSIPSPKAEPFKLWLAKIGSQRIDQMQDPELSLQQAVADYRRLGYSEKWIKNRVRSIEVRNDLTDEWQRSGITEQSDFALLTAIITKEWSGKTPKQYKEFKGIDKTKRNLRDNMTNIELALNTLAEASTTELSKSKNPKGLSASASIAKQGGGIAKNARMELEQKLGHSVISSENALDYIKPKEIKK